jgi:hypothetical protein
MPFSRRLATLAYRELLYKLLLLSYRNTVILGYLWGYPLPRFSEIIGGIISILPSPLL